jgi:hypothetical protein
MRFEDGYGAPEERYPPESLDGVFCELRLGGVSTKFTWRRCYSPNDRADWRRRCSIAGLTIAMDVIGASFGKTGMLSLKAALERQGFSPCYHMVEVPRRGHGPFRREAMRRKARGEALDWDAAFAGYRAKVDSTRGDIGGHLV